MMLVQHSSGPPHISEGMSKKGIPKAVIETIVSSGWVEISH